MGYLRQGRWAAQGLATTGSFRQYKQNKVDLVFIKKVLVYVHVQECDVDSCVSGTLRSCVKGTVAHV